MTELSYNTEEGEEYGRFIYFKEFIRPSEVPETVKDPSGKTPCLSYRNISPRRKTLSVNRSAPNSLHQ